MLIVNHCDWLVESIIKYGSASGKRNRLDISHKTQQGEPQLFYILLSLALTPSIIEHFQRAQAMGMEWNCPSYESAVGGLKSRSSRLTFRCSNTHSSGPQTLARAFNWPT